MYIYIYKKVSLSLYIYIYIHMYYIVLYYTILSETATLTTASAATDAQEWVPSSRKDDGHGWSLSPKPRVESLAIPLKLCILSIQTCGNLVVL